MGYGPPLKGKRMQIEEISEAEFLEEQNREQNIALAQGIEVKAEIVKVEPVAEIAKIIKFKDRISAYMAPAIEEELKAVATAATVIKQVTTPEEREAAQKHATACQKGRTLKVEAPFKEFKSPVTAVGKLFDKRKNDLSALVQDEENRIRGLIDQYDQAEAEKQAEIDRQRKLKVSQRINDLASRGLPIDTEFAEVAEDGEWELHVAGLVEHKEAVDRKLREDQERRDAAQKRIVDRMEIASKLGATLSRDDAELLTDEAFEEMRDKWVIAYNQREEEATKRREEADLVKRAGEAGFALQQCDIDKMREVVAAGQFADLEAVFMVWLGDMTKAKKDDEAKLLAAARLEKRMAQVDEFGIEAAISVLKNATDEEWDCIVAAAKPAPVGVPVVATPSPEAIAVLCTPELVAAVEEGKARAGIAAPISPVQVVEEAPAVPAAEPKLGDSIIPSMEEMKREQLAIREELVQVFQSFKDFGNTHCREVGQRMTDFTGLYLKLKALVERV